MNTRTFNRKIVFGVIILITTLLVVNFFLTYENSKVITRNKELQDETEVIKINTVEMFRTLHLLDIGLRAFAILPDSTHMLIPFDTAVRRKDRILNTLDKRLRHQHFEMAHYDTFKREVTQYYALAATMRKHLEHDNYDAFLTIFRTDPGFRLASVYRKFGSEVNRFENQIGLEAQRNYNRAMRFSYWLQAFMVLLIVPTLFYLGYYSSKAFRFAKRLHQAEEEKAGILASQNQILEREVHYRTMDLQALNEEITTQNEEIVTSNEQLVMQREQIEQQHALLQEQFMDLKQAQQIIEEQNHTILNQNNALVKEVDNQSAYLARANVELKDRNQQLEQFAYIISHNLRGPLSRIQGLSSIMDFATTPEEIRSLADKMAISTKDVDRVVKDLSLMIDIPHVDEQSYSDVNLADLVGSVIGSLSDEVVRSGAVFHTNFRETVVRSIPLYLESIFYNLIQNAIKYRSPDRSPVINILSYVEGNNLVLEIDDNGLGIDTQLHKVNLFMPYKRFHLHVDGRGLGLYLVRARVEALRGKIEVESHVNSGTRFRMVFDAVAR